MITATDLLDLLTKAQKLSIRDVTFRQTDEGYAIILRHNWYDDNARENHGVFITNDNEGEFTWDHIKDYISKGVRFFEFDTMNRILDERLEKQKEKEIKAQKRQELINSLTPEQRELLGV